MPHLFLNSVASVPKPPTLLMLLPENQSGWCEQFSQEGYTIVQVDYPPSSVQDSFEAELKAAEKELFNLGVDWGLITYGLDAHHAKILSSTLALSEADLKACVHFCPVSQTVKGFLTKDQDGKHIPVVFHLPSSQEDLHASILEHLDPQQFDYTLPTASPPPLAVYTYPFIPATPSFPFLTKAPAKLAKEEQSLIGPYIRSATSLSHTRTLQLLKRYLGPHYDLEKLWEKHTFYEFVERDAAKTMSTMVDAPYVNHVPTMTGGVGFKDLSRFYKFHFTGVTPPDSEMITVSRTVGSDRIIDEMIFKCTHTTEIDYLLPGVPPTGKLLQIALVGIVAFRGDKLYFEHLYWDQASVLVQLGLLDPSSLPISGVDVARKVLDPFGLPSNTLLRKWSTSEGASVE